MVLNPPPGLLEGAAVQVVGLNGAAAAPTGPPRVPPRHLRAPARPPAPLIRPVTAAGSTP